MHNRDLNRQLQRLNHLIERTGQATDDIELQGHWGRNLCVVAAGFLENALQTVYSDFAESSANAAVARYVDSRLQSVSNPNAQRFVEVAGLFDSDWGAELTEFLTTDDASRKEALDSLMKNRNQISHGADVGISVHRVRDYLKRSVEVIEFIEGQCAGTSS